MIDIFPENSREAEEKRVEMNEIKKKEIIAFILVAALVLAWVMMGDVR